MATIVVFAGGADADKAKEALEGAGLDFQIVGPTPANLLHIVIGMVGGDDEEEEDAEPAAEEDADASADAEDAEAAEDSVDMTEEGLKFLPHTTIDGERVMAVESKKGDEKTVLFVPSLEVGEKTTYALHESKFSFWPADQNRITNLVLVESNKHRTSAQIEIRQSASGTSPFLVVGKDLIHLYK